MTFRRVILTEDNLEWFGPEYQPDCPGPALVETDDGYQVVDSEQVPWMPLVRWAMLPPPFTHRNR